MEYKFSKILDLTQRAFAINKTKQIKPIKWEVSPEDLHRFMECVLEDYGLGEKKPNGVTSKAMEQARKIAEDDFKFLKPKKKKSKVKRKRK